jgi:hypothetical protein
MDTPQMEYQKGLSEDTCTVDIKIERRLYHLKVISKEVHDTSTKLKNLVDSTLENNIIKGNWRWII